MRTTTESADGGPLRGLLLAVIVVGILGLAAELVLLEHYEEVWQVVPLAALGLALLTAGAVAARPGRATLQGFRGVMAALSVAGLVGVYLHFQGNVEFERESDSGLSGLPLVWEALRGATPALAPGALAQLGLLGLVFAHRHPALATRAPSVHSSTASAPGDAGDRT